MITGLIPSRCISPLTQYVLGGQRTEPWPRFSITYLQPTFFSASPECFPAVRAFISYFQVTWHQAITIYCLSGQQRHKNACWYSWIFFLIARARIGYFKVTWHLTIKLSPAKSLWLSVLATLQNLWPQSEGISALLLANVDLALKFTSVIRNAVKIFNGAYGKSLNNEWSAFNQFILFSKNLNFSDAKTRQILRLRAVDRGTG